jgi:hypothetical protein
LVDIKAYSDLYKVDLEWWEVDAILGIDKAKGEIWLQASQS